VAPRDIKLEILWSHPGPASSAARVSTNLHRAHNWMVAGWIGCKCRRCRREYAACFFFGLGVLSNVSKTFTAWQWRHPPDDTARRLQRRQRWSPRRLQQRRWLRRPGSPRRATRAASWSGTRRCCCCRCRRW
jgi:hypothetical protein